MCHGDSLHALQLCLGFLLHHQSGRHAPDGLDAMPSEAKILSENLDELCAVQYDNVSMYSIQFCGCSTCNGQV